MDKKQHLHEKVINVILSFEDLFTLKKLFEVLRKESIMDDKNKEQIIGIVDDILESPLIEPVPFSNKYCVIKF